MTTDYVPFRYNVSGRHSQTPLPLFTLTKLKDEPMSYLIQLNNENGETCQEADSLEDAKEIAEYMSDGLGVAMHTVDIFEELDTGGNKRIATFQDGRELRPKATRSETVVGGGV